jgi:hypothetical protein
MASAVEEEEEGGDAGEDADDVAGAFMGAAYNRAGHGVNVHPNVS